jgi:hypothetical protein
MLATVASITRFSHFAGIHARTYARMHFVRANENRYIAFVYPAVWHCMHVLIYYTMYGDMHVCSQVDASIPLTNLYTNTSLLAQCEQSYTYNMQTYVYIYI